METTRRETMGLGGLLLGGLALAPDPAGAAAARSAGPDLATPAGRLAAFMMMRGALDDRLVISWVSARYYGVVEDEIRPLFNVRSAVFSRHRPARSGGGFEAANAEIAWFTDPETGAVLNEWRNPYTEQTVKVPGGGFPPSLVYIREDLSLELAKPVPGLEMVHEVLPFELRGDDLYVTERSRTAIRFAPGARPFRYSESNTFHARLAALRVPGTRQVTSDVSFTNVCSWRPWMQMGDRPGHLMATGIGKQGAPIASLPAEWVAATRANRPEVLRSPAALLAPLWNAG